MTRRLVLATLAAATLAACALEITGPLHPYDQLDFPVGVTADPSGRVVWVTSGNFDLAYNGGAVLAIDTVTNTFIKGSAIEVGSFPSAFHLLAPEGESIHGYVLSRETNSLYHATISGPPEAPVLECPGGKFYEERGITRCPRSKSLHEYTWKDPDTGDEHEFNLGADPYAALVRHKRAENEIHLLLTGSMVNGRIATFLLDEEGNPPMWVSVDPPGGFKGLFSFAENPVSGRIYMGSKTSNAIAVVDIESKVLSAGDLPELTEEGLSEGDLLMEANFGSRISIPTSIVQDHARELAITADGTLLLAAYRVPSTVVVIDVREDENGNPADEVIAKIPVAVRPSEIEMAPPYDEPGEPPLPELAYVSCYSSDRVEVIDPRQGMVVDSIRTGRGPFGLAFTENRELGLRRLYVVHFHERSVGVIELDPASPYFHQTIADVR